MRPLDSARAAIAGAITMVVGIWVLFVNQAEQGFDVEDAVFAAIAFLVIILLLLGIDIRRRGNGS